MDNNALRAEVTCSYLHRSGYSARKLLLPFPSFSSQPQNALPPAPPIPFQRETSMDDDSHAPLADHPELPPDVVFLELEASGGRWGRGQESGSGAQNPNREEWRAMNGGSAARISGLEGRLAWARGVLAASRGERKGGGRARARRRREDDVPIVLLLNTQDIGVKAEAEKAGFAGVVVKPLRTAALVACIRGNLWRDRSCQVRPPEKSGTAACGPTGHRDWLVGRRIMVVDDNVVNRKVASKVLEKWEYAVSSFGSGEEALRALMDDHQFDVVFTDIQMPEMDGYDLATAIRSAEVEGRSRGPWCAFRTGGVPIFASTADVLKGTMEKCTRVGMDGMLPKPLQEARLLQAIEESLQPFKKLATF